MHLHCRDTSIILYIFIYVSINVCKHLCISASIHICCMHVYMYVYTYICMYANMHKCVYIDGWMQIFNVCLHAYECTYACIYVCLCACTYTKSTPVSLYTFNMSLNQYGCHIANMSHKVIMLHGKIFAHVFQNSSKYNTYFTCYLHLCASNKCASQIPHTQITSFAHLTLPCLYKYIMCVYVWMDVVIYVCMHAYKYTYACMYVCLCACTYTKSIPAINVHIIDMSLCQ